MTLFGWIVVLLLSLVVVAILIVAIKENFKLRHIANSFKNASEDELNSIYQSIQSKSQVESTAAFLARTNIKDNELNGFKFMVPEFLKPWGNKSIQINGTENTEIEFTFSEEVYNDYYIKGKKYQLVKVPRFVSKSGKSRNQYSPKILMSKNTELVKALKQVCDKYPIGLLTYLLNVGAESIEDNVQTRFGGSPEWIQSSSYQNCDICKKRMSLIIQLPGELLPHVVRKNGMFYFFGCEKHIDQTKTSCQFS